MKAITYIHTGDSSVLELHDRDVAVPGIGEVLVRVMISGVNPTDWKHRKGSGPGQGLDFGEVVPNQDGAGVIAGVGPGVDGMSVGERVWLFLARTTARPAPHRSTSCCRPPASYPCPTP
jgi:NADPH2:quinone reductase